MGTILDIRELPRLRAELDNLRAAYAAQKAELRATPSGKAKGLSGYKLSQIGKKGRELAIKVAELETEAVVRGVLV